MKGPKTLYKKYLNISINQSFYKWFIFHDKWKNKMQHQQDRKTKLETTKNRIEQKP